VKDAGVIRAIERLRLACKAASAASNDLLLAVRHEDAPVEGVAHELSVEVEHICELAEQLEECVSGLGDRR
jgi:hypothetical protein